MHKHHSAKRFGNDPQAFMRFVEDDANYDEARRLGLVVPKVSPSPLDVRVVSDKPASGTPDAGAAAG